MHYTTQYAQWGHHTPNRNQTTITSRIHNLRHRIGLYPQIIYHVYNEGIGWYIPRMIFTLLVPLGDSFHLTLVLASTRGPKY